MTMKKIAAGILIMIFSAGYAQAETVGIQEKTDMSLNGRPSTTYKTTYYGSDRVLIEDTAQRYRVLFMLREGNVYLIDDPNTTAMKMTFSEFDAMSRQGMGALSQVFEEEIVIKESKSTKRSVQGYDCYQMTVDINKVNIHIVYWVTPVADALAGNYYSFSLKYPVGGSFSKVSRTMAVKKVYPIESTMFAASGMSVHGVCTSIKGARDADSKMTVPAGYTIVPIGKK